MMDASTLISSASAPVGTAPPTMSTQTMIRTLCQVLRRMSQLLRRVAAILDAGVYRSLSKIGILVGPPRETALFSIIAEKGIAVGRERPIAGHQPVTSRSRRPAD